MASITVGSTAFSGINDVDKNGILDENDAVLNPSVLGGFAERVVGDMTPEQFMGVDMPSSLGIPIEDAQDGFQSLSNFFDNIARTGKRPTPKGVGNMIDLMRHLCIAINNEDFNQQIEYSMEAFRYNHPSSPSLKGQKSHSPSPPPPPPAPLDLYSYTTRQGDTLGNIAGKFGCSDLFLARLRAENEGHVCAQGERTAQDCSLPNDNTPLKKDQRITLPSTLMEQQVCGEKEEPPAAALELIKSKKSGKHQK